MDERRIINILIIVLAVVAFSIALGIASTHYPQTVTVGATSFTIVAFLAYRGLNLNGLSLFQRAFYILYLLVLIITWSPFKFAAYLSPMLSIGGLGIALSITQNTLIFHRFLGIFLTWAAATFLFSALQPEFVLQNSFIWFFTFSSFYPILIIPSRFIANERLVHRILRATLIILTVEAIYGIFQGCIGLLTVGSFLRQAGDFVDGTIHPWLAPAGRFDNHMYAANISFGILAASYFAVTRRGNHAWQIALLALAFVMSAAIHLILAFLLACGVAAVVVPPRTRELGRYSRWALRLAALAVPVISLTLVHQNLRQIPNRLSHIESGRNQKAEMLKRVVLEMPNSYPGMRLVGLGPGQFGSRANMIGSGYLRFLPPPFRVVLTPPFASHGIDLWIEYNNNPGASTVERPLSSWIALLAELGWFGVLAAATLTAWVVLRSRAQAYRSDRASAGFLLVAGIFYAFFIGAPEAYWEICQAIFVGLLLLKIMYVDLFHCQPNSPSHRPTV